MKALVTGSNGFICGYLVAELLDHGWHVVGLDNFSKYGRVAKSYDSHPKFRLVEGDAKDIELLKRLLEDCEHFVAAAAMIGGIAYFHAYAYDLLAENERIVAAAYDAALWARKHHRLDKLTLLSSSRVYENTDVFPTPEGAELRCPPPYSTYGFQKLACEYYAKGAREQYGLATTIVRPFNCVGIGESRALGEVEIPSGNVKLALSHVVPDLVHKVLKGQDPLHILGDGEQVRHYTYGGDLARGIRLCIEHPAARDEAFNISTARSTNVLELARTIWRKVHGERPFRYVSDQPFQHDVRHRVPDVSKARRVLGFDATTPLEDVLDEVIPWVREQLALGRI